MWQRKAKHFQSKNCTLIFFLICLLITPSYFLKAQDEGNSHPDDAHSIGNTLGIGGQLGYNLNTDAERGAVFVGAILRVRPGYVLGIEGSIGYRADQVFALDTLVGGLSAKVHSIPLTGSLLFFIPAAPHFAPYALAGVGLYIVTIDYSPIINQVIPDETHTRFGYHLGFGVEVPLNENVAIHADYRYVFLNKTFQNQNTKYDFSNKTYIGNTINAGFLVYF